MHKNVNTEQKRFKELNNAIHIAFQRRNQSLQSQRLCAEITEHLVTIEDRRRIRRAKDKESFRLAVELILADLMVAADIVESRWAYRSLCNDRFVRELVKAVTFKKVITLLKTSGYVEQARGGNHSNPFHVKGGQSKTFHPGLASRFRVTEKLLAIASGYGIEINNITAHYLRALPTNVIHLRAASVRQYGKKSSGQRMSVKPSPGVLQLEYEVKQINRYLDKQHLEGAIFNGYYRSFNMGDQPDFYWNKGGRLYSPGEDSYQRMKKEGRLSSIKINNEIAVEIDVNASYLSIFYGMLGEPLPNKPDLYKVRGLHREIVKAWITSVFGGGRFPARWPSRAKAELKAEGISTDKLTMSKVGDRVCKAIPIMAQLPASGITWADLMFEESRAIMTAMTSLRESFNIPAYSMHDGIIVPWSARTIAADEVIRAFDYFGLECRVKT